MKAHGYYRYEFRDVLRSCGHTDALVTVGPTVSSHEPSVLENQQRMKCDMCRQIEQADRKHASARAVQYAETYCKERGIEGASYSSENAGKQVEVRIWLDVPDDWERRYERD